jgi:hypothetical protein
MVQHHAPGTIFIVAALVAGVVLVPLSLGAAPQAQGKETASKYLAPRLGIPNAKRYSKRALKARFGTSYTAAIKSKLRCHRQWRTKVKCKTSFGLGDTGFRGSTTPFYYKRGHNWYWKVRYRIKVIDEYCLYVQDRPRSKCIKIRKGVY